MSLRKLQSWSCSLLRDGGVFHTLRAELAHELSSSSPPSQKVGSSVGDFVVEWDDLRTEDVFLRRNDGEEVAVSAKLGPLVVEGENVLPRDARMKVYVKKHEAEPVLQFDCDVFRDEGSGSDFTIGGVWYHPSTGSLAGSKYRRGRFRTLDLQLREAFKEYLVARGINQELTDFLLEHMHGKEQGQCMHLQRRHDVNSNVNKD